MVVSSGSGTLIAACGGRDWIDHGRLQRHRTPDRRAGNAGRVFPNMSRATIGRFFVCRSLDQHWPEISAHALVKFSEERVMSDEQKKDQVPEAFKDTADRSVEAGIADESAAYDQAMEDDDAGKSSGRPSAEDMGDFA